MFQLKLFNLNWFQCPHCNFSFVNQYSNSNSSDIIFTVSFNKANGVIPFVRTLRSCKCQSKLIILVNNQFYHNVHENYHKILKKCGSQVINVGEILDKNLMFIRFTYLLQFLLKFQSEIFRILFIDSHDSIFQNDPFHKNIKPEFVYIFSEEQKMIEKSSFPNILWLKSLYFYSPIPLNYNVINAGVIIGGVNSMLKMLFFLHEFFIPGQHEPKKINDQGTLYYLYYSGKFKENQISISLDNGKGEICILVRAKKPLNGTKFLLGSVYFSSKKKILCSVVHEYDRHFSMKKDLFYKCPQNIKEKVPDFIRNFS